ncbi:XrtA system polysaccharide chain length determinant [Parahaliea mediterranea]|uniref:Chain length-determining protein n=1 Tax=Parahaliea mediterranea TaxID=651086 RepID=A0A939DG36_9GAMM|nr:XrtA system polysaccharide chain length determinant [Parahaliea mediterranea]MBN7797455.1 chain length-determining protein [Parahaliea mediterranea]
MQEAIAQVFSYIWGVWRHRWLVLIVAWVFAVAGWVWVWQLPEAYVASARVYVDTNSVLRPLLRGLAIQPDIDQRIAMMSRTLLSRPNLEKLMRMTDLDLDVNTELEREEMVGRLREAITLSGERGNYSLYAISVSDSDRETAKRIAQSLITVFIESSRSEKQDDSSGAQTFLDEQIADYEERLQAAEERLAKFKQENVDSLPGGGGDYYSRLESARRELAQAELLLREAENRKRELQRQLNGEEPVFLASGAGGQSPLDSRIQSLQVNLDMLLSRYTDKHPEVRQIQGLIDELQAEKAREFNSGEGLNYSGLATSPVYQSMRSMLAETEARVAELQVRVVEFRQRVEALEDKVNSIPDVEVQLKQLDRDYNVIAAQHNQLLQRRESARLSEDVEQNASGVTFRVIDPPFVPMKPSEPNKILLNAGVLVVSVGIGLGAGLLMSLISPVVCDPRTLVAATGLPLLGTVTLVQPAEERRRELYALAAYSALAVALPAAYVALSIGQSALLAS